jgi:integrase
MEQAVSRQNLTDRFINSRKNAPPGTREDYPDAIVPGLALRVTDRGHKSFVLVTRYPSNSVHPTRRALGDVGAITLEQARQKARGWLELIGRGIDPKTQETRQRAEAQRRQLNSFAAVAAEFLERHASGLKKSAEAKRIIEGEFVRRWGPRPITDIVPEEAAAAIRAIVKRGAPYQAHNAFGYLRRLFNWAIGTHEFGIQMSPVERLSPKDLIGKREARERTLSDDELRAVWLAAGSIGYPYGDIFKLLILTGQRKREVADMRWSEVDFDKKLWSIPAERMKGSRAHEVPLAPEALALLRDLPRFTGECVFTTTCGAKPVNGFSKAKVRMDKLSRVASWIIHDLRRTMRTHLSALPVQDLVRELVIAHARPGLHKVYDQHADLDEKRHCLELWEARVLAIVEPRPSDVTDLVEARATPRDGLIKMETEVLQRILKSGGIEPVKSPELSDGLASAFRRHRIAVILETVSSAKQVSNTCVKISSLASKLTRLVDPHSGESDAVIETLLSDSGIDTGEMALILRRLDEAASEACTFMREPTTNIDGEDSLPLEDLSDAAPEEKVDASPEDEMDAVRDAVANAVLALSLAPRRGKKETPKTRLFLNLRDLFLSLGGSSAIGSGGPLYRFVSACVDSIEGTAMPEPEPFRILMMQALKR